MLTFKAWSEDEIGMWVRSVAGQYSLEPGTVRRVIAKVKKGTALFTLTPELLMSSNRADSDGGWRLNAKQANRLVAAVAGLQLQAEGRDLGPAGEAEIQLDLFAYFPKILFPEGCHWPCFTVLSMGYGWPACWCFGSAATWLCNGGSKGIGTPFATECAGNAVLLD